MCLQQLLGGPWDEKFTLYSDSEGSWEGKVDILRHTEAQKGQSLGRHVRNTSDSLAPPHLFLKGEIETGECFPQGYTVG